MTRMFIELPSFRHKWKSLGLNDDDLLSLQESILLYPKIGSIMQGTGGVRKMRFAFENRGKSGSFRVIYIDFEKYEKVFLLTAYAKNEKANLSKEERNELHELVIILEQHLSKNGVK